MVTLAICLTFIGFVFTYSTSKRALLANGPMTNWAKEHSVTSNALGIFLMLGGMFCAMYVLGVASGIFSFLVLLMAVGSLIVLLSPLHMVSGVLVAVFMVLSFILECYLT